MTSTPWKRLIVATVRVVADQPAPAVQQRFMDNNTARAGGNVVAAAVIKSSGAKID